VPDTRVLRIMVSIRASSARADRIFDPHQFAVSLV
jgi:hypothetical protein